MLPGEIALEPSSSLLRKLSAGVYQGESPTPFACMIDGLSRKRVNEQPKPGKKTISLTFVDGSCPSYIEGFVWVQNNKNFTGWLVLLRSHSQPKKRM